MSGTGSLRYTLSTIGLGSDNITLVIWGRQRTAYTNSSKVKVTLTVDKTDSDEFKKTVIDNHFDMMTLGVSAIKSYRTIMITITLTGNAEIEIGGIQVLKKDFGSFFQYDEKGNVTGSESGNGSTTNVYNSKGLQTRTIGKNSTMYDYEYDNRGNMIEAKTAYGGKIENCYDSYNNIEISVVSNADDTKKLESIRTYENGRHVSSETDELGNTTLYTYDSFGKIKTITDALNHITEYTYDGYDNLTKILFDTTESVDYMYDSQNKLRIVTLPNGTIYSFEYDSSNNLNQVFMNDVLIVTFTYDQTTGLITNQTYGTNGDTFEFSYNAKHNIKEIKVNEDDIKYEYEYDDFDRLKYVKTDNGKILKSYSYNNDGEVIEAVEGDTTIEYQYDSLGEINQRKRTLNTQTIYESFDSTSRSKGFSPDNLIGYLQGNSGFLGTIFNGNAEIKNPFYYCKPYNYKTGGESSLTYTRIGGVPCVTCGLSYPMSYNPPSTAYADNSGCIGFWFYPTSTPTSNRYLFYTKASSSYIKSYVAVYHSTNNRLVLELKDSSETIITITTNSSVQMNQWNFFGLNFLYRDDGQGYAKIFSYELYLNLEMKKDNLSNRSIITSGGLYHIGYRFDGSNGSNGLECKITGLMIGCRNKITTKQMQGYYSLSKDYIIGSSYLDGNSVDFSATSVHNLSETMLNQFEVFPLHNGVKSLKGTNPIAYDVRKVSSTDKNRSFNYNNKIKRYAYVADEGRLEYDLDTADVGTIMMRAYIREDVDKQYILECKDVGEQQIGLYRGKDKYLYNEVNGDSTKTDLYFETDTWHSVGISFYDGIENSESVENAPYVTVRAYLDGNVYSIDTYIPSTFDKFYLSVGKKFDSVKITDAYMGDYFTYYPMLGQIEMLATRASFCEVATLNTLANELKDTTKVSEYDELGMLQKKVIKHKETEILSNSYTYKKRNTNSNYISHQVARETIKYGSKSLFRVYQTDNVGNVTSVTDITFGSHTYTYNARGFLEREDSTEYEYDRNGNITKAGVTSFIYDTTIKDRLKSVNGKEITYGTNPLNPTSYNGNTYEWQGRRLVKYNTYTYTYDDQGLRTEKKVNNTITRYYYDRDLLITEVAPNYRLDFLYDENDSLYGFIYNNDSKYYYIRDFMQNILGIIDTSGNLVVKYGYTAYGEITSTTGSLASTIGAYNPFRYKGYYYDTESRMYYCKSRYYVPQWCRWLNGDHTAYLDLEDINGLNLFAYCKNNPVNKYDPTGHSWESFWNGVGDWFQKHWVEVVVGTAFIVGGALVTALTAGAGVSFMAAFGSALLSSGIQVGISIGTSVVVGGLSSVITGENFFDNIGDSIAGGYMWGGIFAGGAQMIGGAFRVAANSGFATGRNAGIKLGNTGIKLLSPDKNNWVKAGGTLIKFGEKVRFDIGAMWGLHMHILKSGHIAIGAIIAGLIGAEY